MSDEIHEIPDHPWKFTAVMVSKIDPRWNVVIPFDEWDYLDQVHPREVQQAWDERRELGEFPRDLSIFYYYGKQPWPP